MLKILTGVLVVAAAATVGDYIWYSYGVRHTTAAGVLHGALLLTTVGGVLGAINGRLAKGLPIGALAGIGGALSYYALVTMIGRRSYFTAIPAAWVVTWLLLAALDGRWLRAPRQLSWSSVALRGVVAAILSGVSFALVMNTLWGRAPEGGRSYALQFAAWAFAWAPGILILARRSPGAAVVRPSDAGRSAALPSPVEELPALEASITASELLARIDRGERVNILDVRSEGEFAAGHVPGARNVPFTQVLGRVADIPGTADEELILYCGHGPRAYMAAAALRHAGRSRIVYMSGHWAAWQAAGLRIEE